MPAVTYSGTYTNTITLANSPATVASTGVIEVSSTTAFTGGISGPSGFAWAVTNLGIIESLGNDGIGIVLQSGGNVTNGQSGATVGLIAGTETGVYLKGGNVVNGATNDTTALISGGQNGVSGGSSGPPISVVNYGTILGPGSYGSGVFLFRSGGTIVNGPSGASGALISGLNYGIASNPGGPAATIANYGTIRGTGTHSYGVGLQSGGNVTNGSNAVRTALISGYRTGVASNYVASTINNFGTIQSTSTGGGAGSGDGVNLGAGGTVTNQGGALIAAVSNSAISTKNTAATVMNYGTVETDGTRARAVYLGAGGSVTNGSTAATTALIDSDWVAVTVKNNAAHVTNFATIQATGTAAGVYLTAGGTVTNQAGALITTNSTAVLAEQTAAVVTNYGTVENSNTNNATVVFYAGGVVTNRGLITSPRTAIVFRDSLGTVVNFGAIVSTAPLTATAGSGIYLGAGGTVTNGSAGAATATISGGVRTAVAIENGTGTVDNFGTIDSVAPLSGTVGAGVYLQAGGTITNEAAGLITVSYHNAITLGGTVATGAAALVTNFGAISGKVGIGTKGAADTGANTIVNYGTITGTSGIAVALGNGAEMLVIEPGSVLSGGVGNFQPGDTINLPGLAFAGGGSAVLTSGNLLEITEGGQTDAVQLDPNQLFINPVFPLAPDAAGGTLIGLSESFTSGQFLTVPATEYTAGLGIPNDSEELVESGGSAIATTVSGGTLDLQSGGVASAAVIDSGGSADNLGTASNTVVNSGGAATVQSGGIDDATTVSGGGVEIVSAGGTASGTLLLGSDGQGLASGAAFAAASDIIGNTVIIPIAAEQLVYGTAIGTVIDGGTLVLEAGGSLGGAVTFAGSGGTLQILGGAVPANPISGFAPGDAIDLPDIAYDSNGSVTLQAGNTLVLSAGGAAYDLDFDPEQAFVGEQFGFASDSGGGTEIGLTGEGVGAGQVDSITSGQHGFDIDVLSGGIAVVYGIVSGGTIASTGQEYAQPGGSTQNVVILSGGDEFVESGGAAGGTVADGGSQVVYGSAGGTVLNSGSYLYLESGFAADTVVSSGVAVIYGAESGTTDYGGGYDFVFAGGTATGTTLSGGEEYVETGAGATGTVVEDGGAQVLYGAAVSTTLDSGTSAYLEPGSIASGVAVDGALAVIYGGVTGMSVNSTGFDYVEPGGSISSTTITGGSGGSGLGGGEEYVESGATASGTVLDGGAEVVYGLTVGTVIDGGAYEFVYPGGTASGTIVNSGVESIFDLAVDTTVNSGGSDSINDGSASGTIVAGGDEFVEFATSAVGTLVSGAGGEQFVYGSAVGATLVSGGEQAVEYLGAASATIVESGGYEYVASGGAAAGATISGGTVELTSGATAGAVPITFAVSGSGELRLDDSQAFAGTIAGFAQPDAIDLNDISFGADTTLGFQEAGTGTSGTLTIGDGTHTANLTLLGQYVAGQFNLASDGNGGTLVTDPPAVLATAEPPTLTANHHA